MTRGEKGAQPRREANNVAAQELLPVFRLSKTLLMAPLRERLFVFLVCGRSLSERMMMEKRCPARKGTSSRGAREVF